MNTLKHIAAAAVFSAALIGAASPANAAWEFGEYVEGYYEAYARIWLGHGSVADGRTGLEIGCWDDAFGSGEFLGVYTGQNYDTTASYAAEVPLVVTVNGKSLRLSATFVDVNGELGVEASEAGNDLASAFHAIRDASGPIEVAFFQTRLTFPADNAGSAAGLMIDICL